MRPARSDPQAASGNTAGEAARTRRRPFEPVLAGLGLLLCAWLLFPALYSVHLEGFTAQTQSIALLKTLAPTVQHDPYLPLVSQFIYQTRSAVVDSLSVIYGFFPGAGDLAFRGLVLVSLIAVLTASIVFARRWDGTPPLLAFFALILTPGIPETAFFFNDNMVSAAFATTALALISRTPAMWAWLLSGVCFAFAVLHGHEKRRDQVLAGLVIGLTALAVLVGSAVVHGFSVIDAFSTAQKFILVVRDETRWFAVRVLFFGLAAMPVLAVGGWLGYRRLKSRRDLIGIATFIVYPLLLILLAPKASEIRYIFPLLAPMIAMHGGAGLRWVYDQCTAGSGSRRRVGLGIAIFAALVFLLPTTGLKMSDGPRSQLGRMWTPADWARWQGSVRESMNRTGQLVARLDDGRLNVVLATHFNDEFYLRLRLMEAGFLPAPAAGRFPECQGLSLFTKGAATVVHIRTHPQYQIAPLSNAYNAALQIAAGFSCPALASASKTYVSAFGDFEWDLAPEVYSFPIESFPGPVVVRFSDTRDRFTSNDAPDFRKYGLVTYREMSTVEISQTLAKARAYLAAAPGHDMLSRKYMTIDEYALAYRPVPGPTSRLLSDLKSSFH